MKAREGNSEASIATQAFCARPRGGHRSEGEGCRADVRPHAHAQGSRAPDNRYHEDKRRERRDAPLVEDFPLAPEEETPDFKHLAMTLQLRSLRAYEHWNGNTKVILQDIIYQLAEQGAFDPPA